MNIYKKKVIDFFAGHKMDYQSIDLEKNCDLFQNEMCLGLNATNKENILMLPTYINAGDAIPSNEPVVVIDAGGTNLRVALVSFNDSGEAVIEHFESYKMPGTSYKISADDFYETIYEYLLPILGKSDKIGFGFSFPIEIFPNKDGLVLDLSKELKIPDLIGTMLGEGLLKKISEKGAFENKSIVVLNDTTATLLAGKSACPNRTFESYIGMILGTGFNICYIEKNRNIKKLQAYDENSDDNMIINMEAGSYGSAPLGKIDADYDAGTDSAGRFRFEKTISGAYQGGLILTAIKQAALEGLFSEGFSDRLSALEELSSKDIDDFLYYPYSPRHSKLAALVHDEDSAEPAGDTHDSDRAILYYIIDAVIERIAMFITFSLASIMKKTNTGKNPCAPVCVNVDGSTFYRSKQLRSKLDHYVKTFINDQEGLYLEFVKAENGAVIGSAIAALQNASLPEE